MSGNLIGIFGLSGLVLMAALWFFYRRAVSTAVEVKMAEEKSAQTQEAIHDVSSAKKRNDILDREPDLAELVRTRHKPKV